MRQVAEQTGGEAFPGTNDLKRAMQRSMEDGATYYTLAYTPDKVDPQTAFHRIEVKVNHPDAKLAYRRGYYSSPAKAGSTQTGVAALRGALQPGMPPSTMLVHDWRPYSRRMPRIRTYVSSTSSTRTA